MGASLRLTRSLRNKRGPPVSGCLLFQEPLRPWYQGRRRQYDGDSDNEDYQEPRRRAKVPNEATQRNENDGENEDESENEDDSSNTSESEKVY